MCFSPPGEGVWFDLSSRPVADHHVAAYQEDHPGWRRWPEVMRPGQILWQNIYFNFLPYRVCVCVTIWLNISVVTLAQISAISWKVQGELALQLQKIEVYTILMWIILSWKAFLYPFTSPWGNLYRTPLFVFLCGMRDP